MEGRRRGDVIALVGDVTIPGAEPARGRPLSAGDARGEKVDDNS